MESDVERPSANQKLNLKRKGDAMNGINEEGTGTAGKTGITEIENAVTGNAGKTEIEKEAFEQREDVGAFEKNMFETDLINACCFDDLEKLETLLASMSVSEINERNALDETALFYARDERAVERLMKAGADARLLDSCGKTPLVRLVEGGRFKAAEKLLDYETGTKSASMKFENAPTDVRTQLGYLVDNFIPDSKQEAGYVVFLNRTLEKVPLAAGRRHSINEATEILKTKDVPETERIKAKFSIYHQLGIRMGKEKINYLENVYPLEQEKFYSMETVK